VKEAFFTIFIVPDPVSDITGGTSSRLFTLMINSFSKLQVFPSSVLTRIE
jgi:hypothetical protein